MRYLLILFFLVTVSYAQQPTLPPPQPRTEGAFATGQYRNMLAEWGLTDEEIQTRIDATFQQLFYGDDTTERVYYPVGDDLAYIEDINNNDVRSEGISYGMMIAVQMDKKEEFDRLWTWARTNMYHEDGPWAGYFCWHTTLDGLCIDLNPASDGEIWFVTALFFASARWGDGDGIYDYQQQANTILNTMLHKEEDGTFRATNMFDAETKLVVFVPQAGPNSGFTDPSYQAPHYYELWARWAAQDTHFWTEASEAARQHWQDAAHPETGLMANYTEFTGEPRRSGDYGDIFYADAWRTAMMISMDYAWFAPSDWHIEQTNRYLQFFHNEGIGQYNSRFLIDGTPDGNQHRSTGLISMNAAATLASDDPIAWDFIEEFWNTPTPTGQYRYYDGLLQMMALLQLSGNFQIYTPYINIRITNEQLHPPTRT
jgi:oligosaccharide reducing-end xylanase